MLLSFVWSIDPPPESDSTRTMPTINAEKATQSNGRHNSRAASRQRSHLCSGTVSNRGCTFGAHFQAARASSTAAGANANSDAHGATFVGNASTAKNSNADMPAAANTTMPAVNTFWAATTSCKAPNMSPLPHPKHAPAATSDHSGRTKPLCRKAANSAPARKSAHDKTGERQRRAFGWRKATTPETARETGSAALRAKYSSTRKSGLSEPGKNRR